MLLDILVVALFVAGWFLFQSVVLPRLGIRT